MKEKLKNLKDKLYNYVERKDHQKKVEVYLQLTREDPENPRWFHKLGETYHKVGENAEAIAAYTRSASQYAEKGFLLKAIAVCKMILTIDPQHIQTQSMLAELYAFREGANRAPAMPRPAVVPAAPPPVPPAPIEEELAFDEPSFVEPATPATAATQPMDAVVSPEAPTQDKGVGVWLPPNLNGQPLDSVTLGEFLPHASRLEAGTAEGAMYEIPLEEQLDQIFDQILLPNEEPPKQRLLEQIVPIPLFSSLKEPSLKMLIEQVVLREFAPHELIIQQGDQGDSLFVLVEGEALVVHEGTPRVELGRLQEGAFFGEMALIANELRSATVEAVEECVVLEISRDVISNLVDAYPEVLKVLLRFFRERLIQQLSETSELFRPLAGPEKQKLIQYFSFIEAEQDCTLIREGEPGKAFYILLAGRADVLTASSGQEHKLTEMAPGDVFGEIALLTGDATTASVRTTKKCWLLRLEREKFSTMIVRYPQIFSFVRDLVERRSQQHQLPHEESTLNLI